MARARVAIIGAGPAGLVALRTLLEPPSTYDVHVFEKTNRVGGIWNYDRHGGPMYRNLRTNLPTSVMGFKDFPFVNCSDSASFPTHHEVLQYINNFLDHFDGRGYIQFNTSVNSVVPLRQSDNEPTRWLVTTSCEGTNMEEEYQYVFVCNGHYEVPFVPTIPGMEAFSGKVMHSSEYFVPEVFAGKKVVLLGARASGQDIALDLSSQADHVYLSHGNARMSCALPSNVSETHSVVAFENGAFICSDNSKISDVDVFMFCTGYLYHFPFLSPQCGITVEAGVCRPLWKQMVNIAHPSMFFIGLCQAISPIPQFTMQCALARALMEGRTGLPSKAEMLDDCAAVYQRKVVAACKKPRYVHVLADEQWSYNDDIAEIAGCEKVPRVVRSMYDKNNENRKHQLMHYRNWVFEVLSDAEFRISNQNGSLSVLDE